MDQIDIDNMNYALLAGQKNPEIFEVNERAYQTINKIVTDHYPGERTEAIKMIFADLKKKANKSLMQTSGQRSA